MNLSRIDLNLFTVFDVIYTERNLTKAGAVLGITQPAVSNALSRLRDSFEDQLFVRTADGMTPTPVAENIIEPVRKALHLMRVCVQESQVFKPAEAVKEFTISVRDLFAAVLLPDLFQLLQREAPGVNISTKTTRRGDLANELSSGAIDFAMDVPLVTDHNVRHMQLTCDTFACIARKDHPGLQEGLTLKAYLASSHAMVSNRTKGPGMEDIALSELGHTRRIGFRTQHYLLAPIVVAQSDMILTVSERFAKASVEKDERLKLFEVPYVIPTLATHLYWHASVEDDPANRWLREIIPKILKAKLAVSDTLAEQGNAVTLL